MESMYVKVRGRRWELGAALLVIAVCLVSACGGSSSSNGSGTGNGQGDVKPAGDIPDTQAYVRYAPPAGTYAVMVPEGWGRTDRGTGVTFADNLNSIRIDQASAPTAPDVASARSTQLQALAALPGFKLEAITTVTRTAGPAVLITYHASGSPDPVTGKRVPEAVQRYEYWRNGTVVSVTLSSPVGADNVDPWRKVTDSFTWQ